MSGWQVGIDIGGTFTDLVALLPSTRRSPVDQGADPAQRSRRQHQGRARRRRPRVRGRRRPHPRHDPGHQRHRRGSRRAGGAGGDARASRTCSISAAADASISIASTCRRAAPRRCRRSAASAWPSASIIPARPCWRPTPPRSPTRWRRVQGDRRGKRRRLAAACLRQSRRTSAPSAQALAAALPFVSLSHEVNPETREFERTATTVLNASVMPIAARYLDRLQREVKGARLHVMHSAGGMASPEAAARRPLAMALSGPAAGVSAAAACRGRRSGSTRC